ncbi:MAG: MSCRAMM family adhesin SdrC [Verrucomicrobia bacterium]|nr:MSCRAMM family adhesin SdrC [Verrucomicrobiota bacterium]
MTVVGCIAFLASTTAFSQTANPPDLDRDGIPNISDRDVDNDGILNGVDRNIDGGTARSGPLRGRYIGDNLPNDSSQELDMDADGLADIAVAELDIDGDGLADSAANETDIDGDGRLDGERQETDIDGDGLLDNAATETDIDGDARADDAASETDIDGDGLADGVSGEVDTDGDASTNGFDGDVDGDGLANNSDADMHGTGVINDYFQTVGDAAYAPDASVAPTIAYVSGEVRRILQIPATDNGLRVRVSAYPFGTWVYGDWRYLSADNIQIYASWAYPSSDPSQLKVFVKWQYTGPYSGIVEDYSNPANYVISEESRASAQFPGGGFTFVSWVPSQPAGFYYIAPDQQATGFAPPYESLRAALSSYPGFESSQYYLTFSGFFSSTPGLPGVQPIVNLQRTIMQVNRAWYGQLEAQQLR